MTKHEFHNALRLLLNIEGSQLDFLTPVQKDNFFANPHMFFIRADDATADKLWELMFPKPPEARDGVVVDLDSYRRAAPGWRPEVKRTEWAPAPGSAADFVHRHTYAAN